MNFEKLVESRNSGDNFRELVGFRTVSINKNRALGQLDVENKHYNMMGTIHGGVLFTMADIIGGSLASSSGGRVVTVSSNFNYLRAGENTDKLFATAKWLRNGKKLKVVDVEITNERQEVLCQGTFTYYGIIS